MKHAHYFKDVSNLSRVDVYRVLELFAVTDPCIQHAIKKLLVAGGRGAKSVDKDVQEAIDTLQRWQEMRKEDGCAHAEREFVAGFEKESADRLVDPLAPALPQAPVFPVGVQAGWPHQGINAAPHK